MAPQRAINAAVIVYLLFATLWLVAAALGMSGVQLAEGALLNSLLQGLLAGLSMLVLAARLQHGEKWVLGLGLGIWLVPLLTAGLPPLPFSSAGAGHRSSKAEVQERLAQQWAVPLDLRPEWARLATQSAVGLEKFTEAPEIQAEFQIRAQAIAEFMHQHPSEILQFRQSLYRQGRASDPMKQPQAEFEKNFLEGLSSPANRYNQQSKLVLARLQELGLDVKPTPLKDADREKALRFARSWLALHSNWIDKIMSSGPAYTGDPMQPQATPDLPEGPEDAWRRQRAAHNPGLWIALAGIGLAWVGRSALVRPVQPGQLLPQVQQGLRALVRPGGTPRILAGVVVMASAFGLIFLMLALGTTAGIRRLLAGVMMLGAGLIYSGLTVSEEELP